MPGMVKHLNEMRAIALAAERGHFSCQWFALHQDSKLGQQSNGNINVYVGAYR